MTNKEQLLQAALHRAQAFLDQHAAVVGPINASGARLELDEATAEAEEDQARQTESRAQRRSGFARLHALMHSLRMGHMRPIATIAAHRLWDVPEIRVLKVPHARESASQAVSHARVMAEVARKYAPDFIECGLDPDFATRLERAADAVDEAIGDCAAYGRERQGATVSIPVELRRGRRALAIIDALLAPRLSKHPQLLEAWKQAQRVSPVEASAR